MNIISSRIILLTGLSIIFSLAITSVSVCNMANGLGGPPGPAGQMPSLSDDDLKMLEQIDQEVNQYVNSLSEDEQQKFWKEVEDLTKEMNNMSPEELEGFMNQVFAGEAPAQAPAEPTEPAKPVSKSEKPEGAPQEAKPAVLPADQNKVDAALRIIDTILARIENLLTKITPILDIDAKIERWGNERLINNWPATTAWDAFYKELSHFVSDLKKLKARDSRTNAYKYLEAFIQNESLYTYLAKISTELTTHTANIEAVALGAIDVSEPSKKAIQSAIGIIADALYTTQVRTQLTTVFATYDNRAQELKKQEEDARKRAEHDAAQKTPQVRTRIAGKGGDRSYNMAEDRDAYAFGDDFDGYLPSYAPGYQPEPGTRSTAGKRSSTAQRKPATPAAGRSAKPASTPKPAAESKVTPDDRAKKLVKSFDTQLDKAVEDLQSITWIEKVEEHVTNAVQQYNKNDVDAIENVTKSLNRAEGHIRGLKIRIRSVTADQKKFYISQIKDVFDMQLPYLNKISAEISRVESRWDSIKGKISIPKRYAYFGARDVSLEPIDKDKDGRPIYDPQVEMLMRTDVRTSLFDLRKKIDDVKRAVSGLS